MENQNDPPTESGTESPKVYDWADVDVAGKQADAADGDCVDCD